MRVGAICQSCGRSVIVCFDPTDERIDAFWFCPRCHHENTIHHARVVYFVTHPDSTSST